MIDNEQKAEELLSEIHDYNYSEEEELELIKWNVRPKRYEPVINKESERDLNLKFTCLYHMKCGNLIGGDEATRLFEIKWELLKPELKRIWDWNQDTPMSSKRILPLQSILDGGMGFSEDDFILNRKEYGFS